MSGRKEQEYILQEASLRELSQGRIDRREFMTRSLIAGLGLAGVGAVAKSSVTPAFAADRPLTPTFYQWIQDLHPGIPAVNAKFPGINYQIAPSRVSASSVSSPKPRSGTSSWDVYVGQTPFVEMSAFVKAGVIEPWDNYIPKEVIDDIIPSIREECSIDGKLYSWPFFLDVCGTSWHSGITTKAGLPDAAPATWDDFLAGAKKIVDSKAAPWGATFDCHGWRSLAPITHSMSTKVYTPEGLFDFTSEPAIEALKLMKQIMALFEPRHPARGRLRRRRQRNDGRTRLRRAARRPLFQILQRAAAHGGELGRSETAASGAAAEVRQRRGLDGVLDDGLRTVQTWSEQGEGGRIHQGADLRSADLEGFDRRHKTAHPGQLAALQVDLCGLEREQAGLDAAFRRAGARPARQGQGDRQPFLGCSNS
jgi:hypothetical protein